MAIHAGHHAGEGSHWIFDFGASVSTDLIIELGKFLCPGSMIFLWDMHGSMRNGEGDIRKERPVFVVSHKLQKLIRNEIGRVGFFIECYLTIVVPEMSGVKGVGLPLAVVAVESVKVFDRITFRAWGTQAPFAKHPGCVASLL